MENELIGVFGIIIFLLLFIMGILLPIVILMNRSYSKRLVAIINTLSEEAKNQIAEDIKKESSQSIVYRLLGENLFKEEDILKRISSDKYIKKLVNTDDLNICIKLKKNLRLLLKILTTALILSGILAIASSLFFS